MQNVRRLDKRGRGIGEIQAEGGEGLNGDEAGGEGGQDWRQQGGGNDWTSLAGSRAAGKGGQDLTLQEQGGGAGKGGHDRTMAGSGRGGEVGWSFSGRITHYTRQSVSALTVHNT